MQSFHNNIEVKKKYVARTEAHRKADNIIRGTGWNGHRGCAIGCTLEAYNHERYEIELGIPEWLARVEDTLFEGMSLDRAMIWPSEFLMAIPVGITTDQFERRVKAPFLVMVLEGALTTFDNEKFPDCVKAVQGSIALWKRDDIGSPDWWAAAKSAAWSASAESALARRSAASAESAWAAWAAWAAARSSARSAAAKSVAKSAAWSALATRSAESAWAASAASGAKYDYFADELLRLLSALRVEA